MSTCGPGSTPAEFVTVRSAVGLYWLNLALLGLGLATSSGHIATSTVTVQVPQVMDSRRLSGSRVDR